MASGVLTLFTAATTAALFERLLAWLEPPPADPWVPEVLVVESQGLRRWLAWRLAERRGVMANVELLTPRAMVARIHRAWLGDADVDAAAALDEDTLGWACAAALADVEGRPELAPLARYLEDDPRRDRRWALGRRLGTVFDGYLVYRPELLLAWERGEDGAVPERASWQPPLWRAVVAQHQGLHFAALDAALTRAARRGPDAAVGPPLPPRVALFGVTQLAPSFARAFGAASHLTELSAFVCRARPLGAAPAEPLLATLGTASDDLAAVLASSVTEVSARLVSEHLPSAPPAAGALGVVQGALQGEPATAVGASKTGPGARSRLEPDDDSLVVASCHGPGREVEVLREQLLSLVGRRGSTLAPEDVLVVTPDLETYAPLVESIFAREPSAPDFLPVTVAGRPFAAGSPALAVLERLLALVDGRAEAPEVLELLALPPVRERFGLAAEAVPRVAGWLEAAGARWGFDAAHRARHGMPALPEHTFRDALDRLLVGYAMPADGRAALGGVVPFDEVEGQEAELLGALAAFLAALEDAARALEGERPVRAWREAIERALAALTAEARGSDGLSEIRSALAALEGQAATAGLGTEPLSLLGLRVWLDPRLEQTRQRGTFLGGGITCAGLLPARGVPARVIAVLGLGDGAFPRADAAPDFDLVLYGDARRPGDPSPRLTDRAAFLELVLAAREHLIVTFPGQSALDLRERPPSVVVSELVGRLGELLEPAPDADAAPRTAAERARQVEERLVVRHPMQPYSPRYFDGVDPRLFSHDATLPTVAAATATARAPAAALFSVPLPAPSPPPVEVSLGELARFWRDPIRYLLEQRLKLRDPPPEPELDGLERVALDPLAEYAIGDRALGLALDPAGAAPLEPATLRELLRAAGNLPLGVLGELASDELLTKVTALAGLVREHGPREAPQAWTLSLTLPGSHDRPQRVIGTAYGSGASGALLATYGRLDGGRQLAAWIDHLALTLATPGGIDGSLWVGRDTKSGGPTALRLAPPTSPKRHLEELVHWFAVGQTTPLPFEPRAALEYALVCARARAVSATEPDDGSDGPRAVALSSLSPAQLEPELRQKALRGARVVYQRAAAYSPQLAQVFGDVDLPRAVTAGGPDFETLALAVCGPLAEHQRPARGGRGQGRRS